MKSIYYVVIYLDSNGDTVYEAFEESEIEYTQLVEKYEIVLSEYKSSKEEAIDTVKKYRMRRSKREYLK